MSALERWGALGMGQIEGICSWDSAEPERLATLFFNESFRYSGRIYQRMRRLSMTGLLEIQRGCGHHNSYRLTRLGHLALRRNWLARLPRVPESVSGMTVGHRFACAGVGLIIEKFLGLKVLGEREFLQLLLRNLGGKNPTGFHIPDLYVPFPGGAGRGIIEVELHQKSNVRYERLWAYYRGTVRSGDRILYLTPDTGFSLRLLALARRMEAGFVFVCDLPSFRRYFACSAFLNFRREVFRV